MVVFVAIVSRSPSHDDDDDDDDEGSMLFSDEANAYCTDSMKSPSE